MLDSTLMPAENSIEARCNWGAIFCGVFVTLGIAALFLFLGNAIGLSPIRLVELDIPRGLKIGSWIYTLFSWVFSFFLGGVFCSQMRSSQSNHRGALYGLSTWAVSGIFLIILATENSMVFRLLLAGEGPPAAHWLMFISGILGALGSTAGGYMGSSRRSPFFGDRKQLRKEEDLRVA